MLERSTAIFRDPAARRRSLIPLMRRTCEMPDLLARLKFLDFRRDQDFEDALETLVAILRGQPLPRGSEMTEADVQFRDDAALLKHQRRIFERPAFKVSCVWELFLPELMRAIDDAGAALNTGSLYSRTSNLLAKLRAAGNIKLPNSNRLSATSLRSSLPSNGRWSTSRSSSAA